MKKMGGLLLGFLLLSVLTTSLVFAQEHLELPAPTNPFKPIADLVTGFLEAAKPLISPIVGDVGTGDGSGDIFFGKLVIMILLFALTFSVLKSTKLPFFTDTGNRATWTLWVITIAVSILGVRFLEPEFVELIVLSNSAFAVDQDPPLSKYIIQRK